MTNEKDSIIKKLEESVLIKKNIYVGVPITVIKDLTKKEISSRLRDPKNNLYKGTDDYYHEIETEKNKVLTDFDKFLNNSSALNHYKSSNISKVIEDYDKWLVRFNRLQLVYSPIYYKSILKKKDYEYEKVKIVWIDDEGTKNQNTTRTYGHVGEEHLRDILERFLMENEGAKDPRYFERVHTADGYFSSDLTVKIDNVDWIFEFKIKDKSEYITEQVRKDLWQFYKEKYCKM